MTEYEEARSVREWITSEAKRPTRDAVSSRYAEILHLPFRHGGVRLLNEAIVKRWSRSGLDYIKRRAWEIAIGER